MILCFWSILILTKALSLIISETYRCVYIQASLGNNGDAELKGNLLTGVLEDLPGRLSVTKFVQFHLTLRSVWNAQGWNKHIHVVNM